MSLTLKINLNVFVPIAIEEGIAKKEYALVNNMHNLTKVHRIKSEQGLLSDYPHYYQLKLEGKDDVRLYGVRNSENGEFIISSQANDFTRYGRGYLGVIVPNFLGTRFEVYDFGFDQAYIQSSHLPQSFLPERQRICTIAYDTNFFAEKPRSLKVSVFEDFEGG